MFVSGVVSGVKLTGATAGVEELLLVVGSGGLPKQPFSSTEPAALALMVNKNLRREVDSWWFP